MPLLQLLLVLAFFKSALATRGDESWASYDGVFYVLTSEGVEIVDPEVGVIANITDDSYGLPLVSDGGEISWRDAVYVKEVFGYNSYVFAAYVEDPNPDDNGTDGDEQGYIAVISPSTLQVVGRIPVGPSPRHVVYSTAAQEVWVRCDGDASVWVINATDVANHPKAAAMTAFKRAVGHGDMLLLPSYYLLTPSTAMLTNVNEPLLFVVNASSHDAIQELPVGEWVEELGGDPAKCTGLHTLEYSQDNDHLYVECVGGGGVVEIDPAIMTAVALWNVTGWVLPLPGSGAIMTLDQTAGVVHVFEHTETDLSPYATVKINVPGSPADVAFYVDWSSTSSFGLSGDPATIGGDSLSDDVYVPYNYQYRAFFSLANNVNRHNAQAAANKERSVMEPGYASSPFDCEYQEMAQPDEKGGPRMAKVLATDEDGRPVTPECGSCAPQDPEEDFDPQASGVRVIALADAIDSASEGVAVTAEEFVPAGGVLQALPVGAAAECSYAARTRRPVRRGGTRIATIAHVPKPAIWLLDALDANQTSMYELAGIPVGLLWVAERPASDDSAYDVDAESEFFDPNATTAGVSSHGGYWDDYDPMLYNATTYEEYLEENMAYHEELAEAFTNATGIEVIVLTQEEFYEALWNTTDGLFDPIDYTAPPYNLTAEEVYDPFGYADDDANTTASTMYGEYDAYGSFTYDVGDMNVSASMGFEGDEEENEDDVSALGALDNTWGEGDGAEQEGEGEEQSRHKVDGDDSRPMP